MNAVRPVGDAGHDLVQKNDLVLPLAHLDGGIGKMRQLFRQCGELMVMGGKKRPAAVDVVQVLQRCPGDGKPIIGRRAAPDLVEDHEGALGCLIEDRRRLDHLDHEGRASARQIVGSAHPAEQPVDGAEMGNRCRNERTHLRQYDDQGILPEIGGFPRHVGAGDEPQPLGLAGNLAAVGDERARRQVLQRCFHHGMAARRDGEGEGLIDPGPDIAAALGQFGQSRGGIELRHGFGDG